MRTINGKLFLGVLLGVAVLAVAVFAVHQLQYQRAHPSGEGNGGKAGERVERRRQSARRSD